MQTRPLWPDFSFNIQKLLCPFSYEICEMCFKLSTEIKYRLKIRMEKMRAVIVSCVTNGEFHFRN